MDENFSVRRFGIALAGLALLLVGGTIAFHQILHETWISSFYRSVVTVSLTGLDSVPHGTAAKVCTIVLLLAGVAIFAYIAGVIVEIIARGIFGGAWAERRRRQAIERQRDHFIICGYGRVGRRVAEEFRRAGAPYVVLDRSDEALEAAKEHGDLVVEGDGTEDEDLIRAGLEYARGLVASVDDDADNVYITLSARAVRPELLIVARASDEDAEKKLRLAGADRVVLPYATAGRVMANLVLKPQVTAFLDVLTTESGPDLRLEEIEVTRSCPQAGRTIRELQIRDATGANIVALRKQDGSFATTPGPDARIEVGDVLIGVGRPDEIRKLEDLFAPQGAVAG